MLAPYACRSGESRGRKASHTPHAYRTEFQRDRDRILHSPAFRRLEYKTQVFVNGTSDHYRTRLTHTFEMACIGRTMARALGVNEDLTEAIALAHDIGHSPFGHCGERALNQLMAAHGGFDHNLQSLRWVELLECKYPQFSGLNLTWEVRSGLRKHLAHVPGAELDGYPIGPFQGVEAQIADVADDLAYHAHDVDDGLESGLLRLDDLAELELWQQALARASDGGLKIDPLRHKGYIIRCLLDMQVEDVLQQAATNLKEFNPQSPDDVRSAPRRIVHPSETLAAQLKPFREYLFKHMYFHPNVVASNQSAVELMKRLFEYYVEHPQDMGSQARARLPLEGLWRTACDYVSGMTDCYALQECKRFELEPA